MKRRRLLWGATVFLLGCAAAAVVVFLLRGAVTSTDIRETQRTNSPKIDATQETLALVKDCVTPGGKCFERSQAQTAGAVSDINRVVILAAACASGLPDGLGANVREARISACVMQQLAADH